MSYFLSSIKKAIGIDSNSSENNNNDDNDDSNNINVQNDINNNNSNSNSHIPSITTNNNDVYYVYDIIFTDDKLGLGLDRYHGLIPIIDNNYILNNSNSSSSLDNNVDHGDNTHYQQPGNSYSATCPVVKTVDSNLQGFQKSKLTVTSIN